MRTVPEPLHGNVLALSLALANAIEAGAPARARGALRRLGGLYRAKLTSPDPFLTETLADFTGGARAAAKLYRLAIQPCASHPDEPVVTKQVALAGRLEELGHVEEARTLIAEAGHEIGHASDKELLDELHDVELRCAARDRSPLHRDGQPR